MQGSGGGWMGPKQLSPRDELKLVQKGTPGAYAKYASLIAKLANVELSYGDAPEGPSGSFIVGTLEFAIPLEGLIDQA